MLAISNRLILLYPVCYAALALCILVALILVFHWREARSYLPRRQLFITASLAVLALLVLTGTLTNFILLGQQYRDIGSAPAQPVQAQFSHYSLDASIDPASGLVSGTARFLLTPGGQDAVIYLALRPSLQIQHVTFTPATGPSLAAQNLAFTSTNGWTRLDLAQTVYGTGMDVWLEIQYRGIFRVTRDAYSDAQTGPSIDLSEENRLTSYVGEGMAFLSGAGAGSWYPQVWTRQLKLYGNRLPMDTLRLTFPANATLAGGSSAPQRSADGQRQIVTLQPHGVLPLALVGALLNPNKVQLHQVPIWYAGPLPDAVRLHSYDMIVQQLLALDSWLKGAGRTNGHWQAVVMPFLSVPLVGDDLLLLPEYPLHSALPLNLEDQAIFTSFTSGIVAQAWWDNALGGMYNIYRVDATMQDPAGGVVFSSDIPTLSALSSFSAATLADQVLGHVFLAKEEAACSAQDVATLTTLGIENCSSQITALFYLRQRYGDEKLTNVLQKFAGTGAQQVATWRQFADVASAVLGHDTTAELTQYLCQTTKAGPDNSTGKTSTSCLDMP